MAASSITHVKSLQLEVIRAIAQFGFAGHEIRLLKLQVIREDKRITQMTEDECRLILAELRGET